MQEGRTRISAKGLVATTISPDDTESQQRCRVACELVVDPDGPARNETGARDHPADRRKRGESDQPEQRPVARRRAVGRQRKRGPAGPDAEQGEELEDDPDPDPEREPAAVAAQGGRNR